MIFNIHPGNILKGLDKNFNYFNRDIREKIPSKKEGLVVNLDYRPKIVCYVDLTNEIEHFAKIRAVEMYLKDNNVDVDFRYRPLPTYKFEFEIHENTVKVFMAYFNETYQIRNLSIEGASLIADLVKVPA